VDVPLDTVTAPRAAVALSASPPWRLVELGLVDLPEAMADDIANRLKREAL
jgi:hypothetical protein